MRRPRHAFLLAAFLLGGLWSMAPSAPAITPDEAAAHQGRDVRMLGNVVDVVAWDGGGRFRLAHDGHAIETRLEGPLPEPGAWIEVFGNLRREGGLTLWAEAWQEVTAPRQPIIPLTLLAQDPGALQDRRIHTRGELNGEVLVDQGRALQVKATAGSAGPVEVAGILTYEPRCICHVLHIDQIWPWTH